MQKLKLFEVGEFCHHRHEPHKPHIAFDNKSWRCEKCGLYFNDNPEVVKKMRPLLACNAPINLNSLPYPVFSSEKLDGIRCIIKDGIAYSRSLKPIRNRYIQATIGRPEFNGLDGELIVGDPNASDCMRVTNSGVMSIEGEPNFTYYIFDIWNRPGMQYKNALENLKNRPDNPYIFVLPQRLCNNASQLERHEMSALDDGYEGLILRRIDGAYKFGRSTPKEGYLFKLKRYLQDEAVVIGVEPLYRNENDPMVNALGYTHRSNVQSGKVPIHLLGALIVEGQFKEFGKVTFNIGTGFTMQERELLWKQRANLIGQKVSYKFFPVGTKDCPRHPVFVSFRDETDI